MWRERGRPERTAHTPQASRSRRSLLLTALAVAALAAAGCSAPGTGSGTGSSSPPTDAAPRLISPDDSGAEVDLGKRLVLNVHAPDEGSIEGTDASVPFDQLDARVAELRGGMVAWTDSGRTLLAPASGSGGQPSRGSAG